MATTHNNMLMNFLHNNIMKTHMFTFILNIIPLK